MEGYSKKVCKELEGAYEGEGVSEFVA